MKTKKATFPNTNNGKFDSIFRSFNNLQYGIHYQGKMVNLDVTFVIMTTQFISTITTIFINTFNTAYFYDIFYNVSNIMYQIFFRESLKFALYSVKFGNLFPFIVCNINLCTYPIKSIYAT